MAFSTPGVYVVEKSLFPPSVAPVATAIPAFIGYTEKAMEYIADDLLNKSKKISSLKEYERFYGFGAPLTVTSVDIGIDNNVLSTDISQQYMLYEALRMFFENGGGDCYIVSVGKYLPVPAFAKADFSGGLEVLRKVDEPTLILFPDAVNLTQLTGFYSLQQEALAQCGELKDRFALLDLLNYLNPNLYNDKTNFDKSNQEFRDSIGMSELKYGAAYTPWINADITKSLTYKDVRSSLRRNGAVITLKTLTSTLPAADQATVNAIIDGYELLIDDEDEIRLQTNAHFAPAINLKTSYLTLVDNFKKEAFTLPPNTALVRSTFIAMMDHCFMLIDLIDDLLFVVPPPIIETPDLKTRIDDLATTLGPSLTSLVVINNSIAARDLVLSDAVPSVTDYPRQTLIAHLEFTNPVPLASWMNLALRAAITSVVVDATDGKFRHTQATILGAPPASQDQLRIENMLHIEKEISSIFNQFYNAYDGILRYIRDKYTSLENQLSAAYPVYRNIMNVVNNTPTRLPPSSSVAGRYAYVDRNRGVWKAPANVDLRSVKGTLYEVEDKEQDVLNIDVNSGKSINIIRTFSGKGTMIWGARTLAGNDNEWRYVSVRRFFNMVEESCKKSTSWAVFEPNDAGTWVKVKGMIDNFLILQWRAGALQGAKPEEAFYVKVGLGETMTSLDILEGRMNVEIGMAVVRPAEFIILTFSHKLATS